MTLNLEKALLLKKEILFQSHLDSVELQFSFLSGVVRTPNANIDYSKIYRSIK